MNKKETKELVIGEMYWFKHNICFYNELEASGYPNYFFKSTLVKENSPIIYLGKAPEQKCESFLYDGKIVYRYVHHDWFYIYE